MIYDLRHLRRAAEIAANAKCWIGIGCVIAKDEKVLAEAWNETLAGEEYCREFRRKKAPAVRSPLPDLKSTRRGVATAGFGRTSDFSLREKSGPSEKKLSNKGCIRYELKLSQGQEIERVCSIHAEVNAIAKAARKGIKIDGATMFITSFPCLICMRSIIAAGIKKVIYMNDFYKPHHLEMFTKNNIKVEQLAEDKV